VLVLESTYGDRRHEDRHTRSARLGAVIEHALRDGGTVLIPAFSIGRTQELRLIAGSGTRSLAADPHRPRLARAADRPRLPAGGRLHRRLSAPAPVVGPRGPRPARGRRTPGRDIQRYGPRGGYVQLDGRRYDIRAQVHRIGGYSAHADQQDLIDFVSGMPTPPPELRLVHGDARAKAALAERLGALLPGTQVVIP